MTEQQGRIRLMASYDYSPFWLSNGVGWDRVARGTLALTEGLTAEVQSWNEIYYDMRDWKDPGTIVSSELERKLHYLCGLSLAQRIANSLQRDIYFFDPHFLKEERRFSPGNS